MAHTPRGIRNHNPLNIDRRDGVTWAGQNPDQSADPRFIVFLDPRFGFRAAARVIRTYGRKYGARTIEDIISRWAPPAENDTPAYIRGVEMATGMGWRQAFDFKDDAAIARLLRAMCIQENGTCPYDLEDVILAGVKLENDKKATAQLEEGAKVLAAVDARVNKAKA